MSEETQIADGYYDAVVRAADIIENRFSPEEGYEVEIEVGVFDAEKKPITKAFVYLELSMRPGVGNNANRTSYEVSMEKLAKLGFAGGDDLSRIGEIVGKPCRVSYQTKDPKTGLPLKYGPRWSLTFQRPTKRVDPKEAMAKLKTLMAGVAAPSVPQTGGAFNAVPSASNAGAPPPPPGDPFANL